MSAMVRMPKEIDVLDGEAFDAPRRLTLADAALESGPGWRRRDDALAEREDEQ